MTGHSTYVPKSALARWFESRLPIMGLVHSSFIAYPTPKNLNYWWTFGGIATFMLAAQIVTGVVLAMQFFVEVDVELSVAGGANHHTEDKHAVNLKHHFDFEVLLLDEAGPHLEGKVLVAIFL